MPSDSQRYLDQLVRIHLTKNLHHRSNHHVYLIWIPLCSNYCNLLNRRISMHGERKSIDYSKNIFRINFRRCGLSIRSSFIGLCLVIVNLILLIYKISYKNLPVIWRFKKNFNNNQIGWVTKDFSTRLELER